MALTVQGIMPFMFAEKNDSPARPGSNLAGPRIPGTGVRGQA